MGVKNAEYWGPAPKEAVKEGAFQPAPGVHGPHSRPLGWLFREAVRVVLTRSQHDADAAGSQAKAAPRALQRDWQSAARCRRGPAGGAVGPPPGSPPARPPPRRGAGTRRMRPAPRLTCAPPPAGPLKARRSAGHPSRAGEPASGRLPRTTGAGAPRPRLSLRSEHPGDWPGLRRRRVQPQPPAPLGARVEPHAPGERSSLSRKHLSHQLRQGERTGRAAAHAPPLPLCFGGVPLV